jgi:hypothetical protein
MALLSLVYRWVEPIPFVANIVDEEVIPVAILYHGTLG